MESSSIFKPYEHYDCWRGEKQTMLRNSIGRQLPFIVNFKNNLCQIFDIDWEKITHSFLFPEGSKLIDVDYFPSKEGQLGVLIGVEDVNQTLGFENYVVALAADPDGPTMKVTHSAEIPVKITTVKTLFSSLDMVEGLKQKTLGLFHRLLEWNHVVAIGCKETRCYLTQLSTVNEPSADIFVNRFQKRNIINLLDPYIDQDIFSYTQEDDLRRDYPASAVYVSALALMPRSRTLLVGLSMGGILSASLNPSNQMMFLELRHERLVRQIAPLEPEDDPDKFEYFIVGVDRSSRHPIMMQLWRGSFKTIDQVVDSEKYDRPVYNVCLEHKIPFGERWFTMSPIVMERGLESGFAKRRDDSSMESMLNVSQTFGSALNRSHVLLAYERKKLIPASGLDEEVFVVEAAIFDIDAWYYKRTPVKVSSDGTTLRQCPFMSCIKSDILAENVGDIGILTLCATDVSRFVSMVSDADQLFYPSALSYDRVIVAEKKQINWMKIQNIQETILDKCASKLPLIIRSPDAMAADIIASGLVRKNVLSGSPNSSAAEINESELSAYQKVILNAMVYYGKIDEFCNLATRHDLSDRFKAEIAEWALHEAVDFKRTISDRTVSLFQGNAVSLSPLAEDTVFQGIKLFRVVYEYLGACAKNTKGSARLSRLAHSVKCMRNHTKLVSRFIIFHIVPVDPRVQQIMRENHEKRKNVALKNKTALPIQLITRNMHRLAPDTQFWNDMPHDEWYPPTPLDLLESILNVNIPERVKRELIVQYVVDWLRASPHLLLSEEAKISEANPEKVLTDADRDRILAMETIKVMTNQMFEVDLEKIYFSLEQETAALTKKADKTTGEEGNTKKVFLLDDDGLTYEKLWNGKTPMALTIGQQDLERFEQRMKLQTSEGKKRMPVLDPETEMLYQVFLFENQKYNLMSDEAIESNELLCTFMPAKLRKRTKSTRQKSARELEIEQTVKTMLERNLMNEEDEMPEVFAAIEDKHGRKRKSESGEGMNTSPAHFVPPTAKRIQQCRKSVAEEPANTVDLTASSVSSPQERDRDAEINMMIATPARYYKRPATSMSVNQAMVSPVHNQKMPLASAQNSILKTAKSVQSPSRGRIRFHASVRRGANESIDSMNEETMDNVEEAPKPKGLNFAILEDEEEDETATSRHSLSVKRTSQPPEPIAEECIEMEKSFENQEDFEVLEDAPEQPPATEPLEEDTFEIRTDDIIPGSDETFELTEREEMPEKNQEIDADDEMLQGEMMNFEEVETVEKAQEEVVEEIPEEEKQEEQDDVEEKKEDEKDDEKEDEPWDGIHRSFEIQKDEDCDPVVHVENEEDQIEPEEEDDEFLDAHNDLAVDVPLDRTFEVQDDGPQPRADVPDAARTEVVVEQPVIQEPHEIKVPEVVEPEEYRPPSANTRSAAKKAANSRPATPEEPVVEPPKSSRKARGASVQRTSEAMDEEERPLSRRTRGASAKKDPLPPPVEEEVVKTPRKSRASSVKKDKLPLNEEKEEEEANTTVTKKTRASSVKRTPAAPKTPRARTMSRTQAEASPPQEQLPSSSRVSRSVSRSSTRGQKPVVEERSETPTEQAVFPDASSSTLVRRLNSRKSSASRASSVVTEPAATSAKRGTKAQASTQSTPRRGRSRSEAEETTAPATSSRTTSKKRRSSESEEPQEEEPPKKARGRPRTTPMRVIPEAAEEVPTSSSKTVQTPKRGGSRSRTNSTSSSAAAPATPKREKKPALDDVSEENEEAEPATPLRRSSRRLQNP